MIQIPHSRPFITREDEAAVVRVLSSGMVAQGGVASQFANELATYTGLPEGVLMGSGSAAITLALRALQLPAGGEVIIPTYVCRSVGDAIVEAGLAAVLCDVGHEWNMTAQNVAAKMNGRTVALIVPHVFGIINNLESFAEFGVPVIEDACQSLGTAQGHGIGRSCAASVFSFNGIKCLTTGEGGYVTSADVVLSQRMRELSKGGSGAFIRYFSPMSDMQAALGISQLLRYDNFLSRRRDLAERYLSALADSCAQLPTNVADRSIFFRFPVRIKNNSFDETRIKFQNRGVAVRRGVDALLHRAIGQADTDFPVAEQLFRETVSLPLYPAMTHEEQDVVIDACLELWAKA